MRRTTGRRKKSRAVPEESPRDWIGRDLEEWVANIYRQVHGAQVTQNIEMGGRQIDVRVELQCVHAVHRMAIEVKGGACPVGVKIVSGFAETVRRLREQERSIDEGVIVSTAGFTTQARNAAKGHVTLLETADLEVMVAQAAQSGPLASSVMQFYQAIRSGRYDDAGRVLWTGLVRQLYHGLGDYRVCTDLLQALFPDGEDRLPRLTEPSGQVWVLNTLANLHARTRADDTCAERLYEKANGIDEALGNKASLAIGLFNLADVRLRLGRLDEAEANLRRGLKLSQQIGDEFHIGLGHQELGHLLIYKGAFEQAEEELNAALSCFTESKEPQSQSQCMVRLYLSLCDLLSGKFGYALDNARRAHRLANPNGARHFRVERDVLLAKWLLGWSLVASAGNRKSHRAKYLTKARRHLEEALADCRRIGLVELEPDVLLALARCHCARGDRDRAVDYATQALHIADCCGYRLTQTEIHVFLAHVAMNDGDRETARAEVKIAKGLASCNGSGCCHKPALDEAMHVLG